MPSFTSLNANCAVGSAIDDVAARDEPAAAAERVTLHAPDHRRGAGVDRVEHRAKPQRVGDVLLVGELDRRAHPFDVGARGERRPVAGQHDGARVADVRERRGELVDQRRRRTRCAVRAAPSRPAAPPRRARSSKRSRRPILNPYGRFTASYARITAPARARQKIARHGIERGSDHETGSAGGRRAVGGGAGERDDRGAPRSGSGRNGRVLYSETYAVRVRLWLRCTRSTRTGAGAC